MVYGNCVLLLLTAWRKLQINVNTNWKENMGIPFTCHMEIMMCSLSSFSSKDLGS